MPGPSSPRCSSSHSHSSSQIAAARNAKSKAGILNTRVLYGGGAVPMVAIENVLDGHHGDRPPTVKDPRSEEHTSELQSRLQLVCRLLLEKKKNKRKDSAYD